jgi:hypothetical protein
MLEINFSKDKIIILILFGIFISFLFFINLERVNDDEELRFDFLESENAWVSSQNNKLESELNFSKSKVFFSTGIYFSGSNNSSGFDDYDGGESCYDYEVFTVTYSCLNGQRQIDLMERQIEYDCDTGSFIGDSEYVIDTDYESCCVSDLQCPDESSCCPSGNYCTGHGTCCPTGSTTNATGSICCDSIDYGPACGNQCCPTGYQCADQTSSICCPGNYSVCGPSPFGNMYCCSPGTVCGEGRYSGLCVRPDGGPEPPEDGDPGGGDPDDGGGGGVVIIPGEPDNNVDNDINGQCGDSINTCNMGTFSDLADNDFFYFWSCLGENGGSSAFCNTPKNLDALCGAELNTCEEGILVDTADNDNSYLWDCLSVLDGENASCSLPKTSDVDGECGLAVDDCLSGDFLDVVDSDTDYLWSCLGSGDGSDASCSLPIDEDNDGVCGLDVDTCDAGVYQDVVDSDTEFLWDCLSDSDGSDASCRADKEDSGSDINGECGSAIDGCLSGDFLDVVDSDTDYLWSCLGSGDGSDASCSLPIDEDNDGVCGLDVDTCDAGVYQDVVDSDTEFLWDCLSDSGGNDASCRLNKEDSGIDVTGVCGLAVGDCTAGTYQNVVDSDTHFLWNCNGSGDGADANCSVNKQCIDGDDNCPNVCTPFNDDDCITYTGNNNSIVDADIDYNGDLIIELECISPTDVNFTISGDNLFDSRIISCQDQILNTSDLNSESYRVTFEINQPCTICKKTLFITGNDEDMQVNVPDSNLFVLIILISFIVFIIKKDKI